MNSGTGSSAGVPTPSGSAQAAEEEDMMMRKLIHDNSPHSSKRWFVIVTLGLLGGIFTVLIVSLSSRSDIFYTEISVDVSSTTAKTKKLVSGINTSFTVDLNWCTTVPDQRKRVYVYFGPDSSPLDHHVLVQGSYSPTQLTGESSDKTRIAAECSPLATFGDFAKIFKTTVDRPLAADPLIISNIEQTYADEDLIVPCGLRSLFTLMRSPI